MSFMGGFGQGLQNSAQAMLLKQLMLRGQQGGNVAPGAPQTPPNAYPEGGGQVSYDPRAMEDSMDAALGKTGQGMGNDGIQSSGMYPQAATQMPPPNILAGLKALMMGQGGF